jgi:gamma-glutamylcyclotransferase (GGCT)/AIG2-like uncharacterized protein YtfP
VSIKYFAYASNMDTETFAQVAPGHRKLGVACLPDHRLAFTRRSIRTGTGVADVLPSPGESVCGVLYELEDDDLTALDEKEGYDWAYLRDYKEVLPACGEPLEALVYSVREKEPHDIPPSPDYARRMVEAAYAHRLDPAYVERLRQALDSFGIASP